MESATTGLVHYDAMVSAIVQAFKIDEVKDIRDKALALEMYSRLARNLNNERLAAEIRIRAEYKAGLLLNQREMAKGGNPNLSRGTRGSNQPQTLEELGISHDQSSKWQQLAEIPPDQFEAALKGPEMPTTNGILAAVRPEKSKGPEWMESDVLWMWGRLRDFEERGMLAVHPRHFYDKMHGAMQRDVRRLVPLVRDWLKKLEGIRS